MNVFCACSPVKFKLTAPPKSFCDEPFACQNLAGQQGLDPSKWGLLQDSQWQTFVGLNPHFMDLLKHGTMQP